MHSYANDAASFKLVSTTVRVFMESWCISTANTDTKIVKAPNVAYDKLAAGRLHIPLPVLLAPGLVTAAIMVLLWDSSLPGMT